jgi:hypothetical protein
MSYDIKFRQRAVEYWREGHTQRATAAVFKMKRTPRSKLRGIGAKDLQVRPKGRGIKPTLWE